MAGLAAPAFDPRRTVLLECDESDLPADLSAGARGAGGQARVLSREPERVVVAAQLSRPGVLVLHDVYYPGWKAFVAGRELPVLRANYLFRAAVLPAGEHRVEFRYEPDIFYRSAVVSAAAWAACVAALIILGVRGRRSGGHHAQA